MLAARLGALTVTAVAAPLSAGGRSPSGPTGAVARLLAGGAELALRLGTALFSPLARSGRVDRCPPGPDPILG